MQGNLKKKKKLNESNFYINHIVSFKKKLSIANMWELITLSKDIVC